jgi:hypothetical protein
MLLRVSTMELVAFSKLPAKHILRVCGTTFITFTSSDRPQWCCAQEKCFQKILL